MPDGRRVCPQERPPTPGRSPAGDQGLRSCALAEQIRRLAPSLRAQGIDVEVPLGAKTARERIYRVAPAEKDGQDKLHQLLPRFGDESAEPSPICSVPPWLGDEDDVSEHSEVSDPSDVSCPADTLDDDGEII